MSLSSDIIAQFVKATKDEKKTSTEASVYGTVVDQNDNLYVQLDGSDVLTPVSSTVKMEDGERVVVTIKDHTATVTGNLSTPSARSDDVDDVIDEITEVEILIGNKVDVDELNATIARIDTLVTETATITGRLTASEADISELRAGNATISGTLTAQEADIKKLTAEKLDATFADITYATISELEATNATIVNLEATYGNFIELSTDRFEAIEADIGVLDTTKLSADEAAIKYANIDFANIGEAAIENFFSKSGIIGDLVVSDGYVTGSLVGVTIKGDLIEAGTLVADKLVIMGEDGLYYRLNFESGNFTDAEEVPTDSLHGSVITAHSITAEQIYVDDLIAFDATIGGFHIGENSIYSGVKESIDNATRGIYMDTDAQVFIGDSDNYIRYYKDVDEEGNEVYRLAISADSLLFGANAKTSASDLLALTEHVKIGTYTDPITGDERPSVELAEGDSDFKQVITNTETMFMDGNVIKTRVDTDGIETDNVKINGELRHGDWVWSQRSNGNYGLIWKEAVE